VSWARRSRAGRRAVLGVQASLVERPRQEREHGPIQRCELRAIDLSSQNQDLMTKSENLGVTTIAGHQQETDTTNQKAKQMSKKR